MGKITQKIELTTNILIIVATLVITVAVIQKYFWGSSLNAPSRIQPTIGMKVDLPNTDLSNQPKTLILALQKGCHFCSESAPFYKRIIQSVSGKNIKLIAVLPNKIEDSQNYLNELGLSGIEIKQAPLDTVKASGTPTLILANDKGEVTDFWIGKLPVEKESEVINKLNS